MQTTWVVSTEPGQTTDSHIWVVPVPALSKKLSNVQIPGSIQDHLSQRLKEGVPEILAVQRFPGNSEVCGRMGHQLSQHGGHSS